MENRVNDTVRALIYLMRCALHGTAPAPEKLSAFGAAPEDLPAAAAEQGVVIPAGMAVMAMEREHPGSTDPAVMTAWAEAVRKARAEAYAEAQGDAPAQEAGPQGETEEERYLSLILRQMQEAQREMKLSSLAELFLYVTRGISRSFRWDAAEEMLAQAGAADYERNTRTLALHLFGDNVPSVQDPDETGDRGVLLTEEESEEADLPTEEQSEDAGLPAGETEFPDRYYEEDYSDREFETEFPDRDYAVESPDADYAEDRHDRDYEDVFDRVTER